MNNGRVYLQNGMQIYVTIGSGGESGRSAANSGGTSSFGTHIAALGGGAGSGGNDSAGGVPGRYYGYYYSNGVRVGNITYGEEGGGLYYNTSNSRRVVTSGTTRLYYGDGSNTTLGGTEGYDSGNLGTYGTGYIGNNGLVIVTYMG